MGHPLFPDRGNSVSDPFKIEGPADVFFVIRINGDVMSHLFDLLIENRKSNATEVPAVLKCFSRRFAGLTLTSPFRKGGLRGISQSLKSPLTPLFQRGVIWKEDVGVALLMLSSVIRSKRSFTF